MDDVCYSCWEKDDDVIFRWETDDFVIPEMMMIPVGEG